MSLFQKIFDNAIKRSMSESDTVAEWSRKIATGKMKVSEVKIIARGGNGISIRDKRIANKVLKRSKINE